MFTSYLMRKSSLFTKTIACVILINFLFNSVVPAQYAQAQMIQLPAPGTMVPLSNTAYVPTLVRAITIHPDNPMQFDFIVDTGHSGINIQTPEFKEESMKLVKYFFAALTTPEKDMWVNLSPYEKTRMIADNFGDTEMGRDLLAQDYLLKQITSSLMYPESDLGKKFWENVYAKAQALYGTTEIPYPNQPAEKVIRGDEFEPMDKRS